MRGCIVQRTKNKGTYSIKISLGKDSATGKYKYQWYTVQGSKKDAEKRLSELLHQLDTGNYMKPGKTTVADYLNSWLSVYCWPNLAPRTAESYQYIVRHHLTPTLGNIPLTQLKAEHLQHLYTDKLSTGLSNRTVQYLHVTLHKALSSALKLGMITRNPADAVEAPKVIRHEMRIMNESDIHIFLEYAKDTAYYPLFYLALFTGMRRSELLALRWSDIDLLLCQLSVTRTIHQLHTGKIIFGQPKTGKSRRVVSLSPSTSLVLKEHQDQQVKIRESLGLTLADDDLVFCKYDGNPLLPDSITHAWARLAKRTGLKGIRLHDARHTHASLMLKQGVHPKIVQERLGHASITITLDTYSHVAPGLQQAAANRFDDIVIQGNKSRVESTSTQEN